jgi:hypothetical protein
MTLHDTLEHDLHDLQWFLSLQKKWLAKATYALSSGYYFESAGICMNQLHAVLRKALWLESLMMSIKSETVMHDAHLWEAIIEERNTMPRGVPGRELYGAAAKQGFIDGDTRFALAKTHEDLLIELRQLFQSPSDERRSLARLKELVSEFLELNTKCVRSLERRVNDFRKMIPASKNQEAPTLKKGVQSVMAI